MNSSKYKCDFKDAEYFQRKGLCKFRNGGSMKLILLTWKAWKIFTQSNLAEKREKTYCDKKIEDFLERLKIFSLQEKQFNFGERIVKIKKNEKVISVTEKEEKINKMDYNVPTLNNSVRIPGKDVLKPNISPTGKSSIIKFSKTYPKPKLLIRMEQRKLERKNRWKEIENRKKTSLKIQEQEEEKRNRMYKEKKLQDKMERERKEKEASKVKAFKKKQTLQKMKVSRDHHLRKLGLKCLGQWKTVTEKRKCQCELASLFWDQKIMRMVFINWKLKTKRIIEKKIEVAGQLEEKVLKRNFFGYWLEYWKKRKEKFRVAKDWNEIIISLRYFNKWKAFRLEEAARYLKACEIAEDMYRE